MRECFKRGEKNMNIARNCAENNKQCVEDIFSNDDGKFRKSFKVCTKPFQPFHEITIKE